MRLKLIDYFAISLQLLLLSACTNQDKSFESSNSSLLSLPNNVDLIEGLNNNVENFYLSDIADSIKFIPLEKTESSLFAYVRRVEIDGNNVIVDAAYGQTESFYFRYNIDGRFINSIGRIGRGPGEYSNSEFSIDYEKKRIAVLRWYSGKDVILYNYDGDFLGRLPIKPVTKSVSIACLSGGRVAVYRYNISRNWPIDTTINLFDLYDSTGCLISSVPSPLLQLTSRPPNSLETPSNGTSSRGIYRLGKEAFLYSMWDDTIYITKGDSIKPAFILSKDRYSAPIEIRYRGKPKDDLKYLLEYLSPYLLVTDSLLFIEQHLGEEKVVFRYNRYTGLTQSSRIKPTSRHERGYLEFSKTPWFIDDLSGSNAQVSVREVTGEDGSIIAMAYEPSYFRDLFDADSLKNEWGFIPEMRNQRLKVLQSLSEDDNPVLVIIYLKKNSGVTNSDQ
jgi:hypothetical protein